MKTNISVSGGSKALIDFFANKELSFGCEIVKTHEGGGRTKYFILEKRSLMTGITLHDKSFEKYICYNYTDERLCSFKFFGKEIPFKDYERIGHKVKIGDVLEKFLSLNFAEINGWNPQKEKIVLLWQKCGFTESLNEILDEEVETGKFQIITDGVLVKEWTDQFKDSNTQALYEFLWGLFGDKIISNF